MTNQTGQIVKSYGRRYIVESDGQYYDSTTRGKRTDYACGDHVTIAIQNQEQAVIEAVLPRQTLLYRSDSLRSKLIAANVTQIAFVLAAVPSFNEELLMRCLVAAEAAQILPLIVLNKNDLPQTASARTRLIPYAAMGYPVLELSAKHDSSLLREHLLQHTSVFVGQSGMGKSTLTNALLPEAQARVGEISSAIDSGKHTTTHATLYHLNAQSHLIDSPGLQGFGLRHLVASDLLNYFPDLRGYGGQCRFHNCAHLVEPGCAVLNALQEGVLSPERVGFFQKIMRELQLNRH